MSKVNPINMSYLQSRKIMMNAVASMTRTPKLEIPKIEPENISKFDFSTEARGYFMHNGKRINIIFPR